MKEDTLQEKSREHPHLLNQMNCWVHGMSNTVAYIGLFQTFWLGNGNPNLSWVWQSGGKYGIQERYCVCELEYFISVGLL
jgi:hypothetical protein